MLVGLGVALVIEEAGFYVSIMVAYISSAQLDGSSSGRDLAQILDAHILGLLPRWAQHSCHYSELSNCKFFWMRKLMLFRRNLRGSAKLWGSSSILETRVVDYGG